MSHMWKEDWEGKGEKHALHSLPYFQPDNSVNANKMCLCAKILTYILHPSEPVKIWKLKVLQSRLEHYFNVVYFNQQISASQGICLSKSCFSVFFGVFPSLNKKIV